VSDPGPPYALPEGGPPAPPPPPGYGYGPPPPGYGYGPPPPGYGYGPPPGYANYGYGEPPYGWDGPPGKIRPTGISIVLFICTLGIYTFVYNYSVHSEMKRHSGRGIGGGIALLLSFLAWVAMPFVTAAEVGSLYARRGRPQPVSGWTGLWLVVPFLAGYIAQFAIVIALFDRADGIVVALLIGVWITAVVGGSLTWFIKTNDALNDYWRWIAAVHAGKAV